MIKNKKNIKALITTTSLLVVGLGVSAHYLLNSSEKNIELNNTETLLSDINHETNSSPRMFTGTTLLKQDVEFLGWHTKTNITLADWEQAPNVVTIGGTDPSSAPWRSNTILRSIEIPDRIRQIGVSSFQDSNITQITFSNNSLLTTIGDRAFENSKLLSLRIPDLVTNIGPLAFNSTQGT
ncbi:MAG: leucine-rich repeat domain-containing protein, partial [Metamycoplasmataceae bacterium]